MKLLRSYPLLAFLLVLVAIAGYSLAQQSLVLLIVAGTLAVVSWFVTEGPRGRTIPNWLSNVLVLGVSLGVIVDWYQHQSDWTAVLGRYAVWLSVIKLYEDKSPRDYGQLLAYSLLLMVTGTLQSADLLFSIALLVYAVIGFYVLLLFQLHGSYEREKARRAVAVPRGYRLAPVFKPVIGQRVGAHFKATALVVGCVGLFLSVILFLAVPRGRGEETLPGLPTASERRTAFLNQVNLGRGSRITSSRRLVMRVEILDAGGEPLRDPPYYIRGGVMEMYRGEGRWRPLPPEPVLIGTIADEFTDLADGIEDDAPAVVQRYKLDVSMDVLPALDLAVSLKSSAGLAFGYDPVARIIHKPEGIGRLQAYEIRSLLDPARRTRERLLHDQRVFWTSWRYRNRRVQDLARRVLAANGVSPGAPTDVREARLWSGRAAGIFRAFLSSEQFTYTLDLSDVAAPAEGADPIETFLFETRRGHCEYFASAMTALCHTVGIQARIVTGFIAYEYDEAAGEYIISENNAHAWVEVRTGPLSWERFDPTPAEELNAHHDLQATLPDQVQRLMSRLETGFAGRFLQFNERDQQDLSDMLDMGWSERLQALWEGARDWAQRVNRSFQLGWAGYAWMGIVAFALVIAVIALIKLMRRSIRLRSTLKLQYLSGAEYQRMLRQLGFYLDMLYVLRRGGLEKPHWLPPARYAEVLSTDNPRVARLVADITEVFYAARYGRRPLRRAETQAARKQVEELAAELGVKL